MDVLDLFCGGGGAAMGYALAGHRVIGVDHLMQRHYPFEFIKANAMTFPLDGFDIVHASPPCQGHSFQRGSEHEHRVLLRQTIDRIREAQPRYYVVENVMGAFWPPHDFTLCASSFGCITRDGSRLFMARHRKFWSNVHVDAPPCMCKWWRQHGYQCGGVYGSTGQRPAGSVWKSVRANLEQGKALMGIDWLTRPELSEAIPPVYTWWISQAIAADENRCRPMGADSARIG